MGRLGAEILFKRMHGDDSPAQQHVVPTSLITRGSGEIRLRKRASSTRQSVERLTRQAKDGGLV
jgi:hypothetical protein